MYHKKVFIFAICYAKLSGTKTYTLACKVKKSNITWKFLTSLKPIGQFSIKRLMWVAPTKKDKLGFVPGWARRKSAPGISKQGIKKKFLNFENTSCFTGYNYSNFKKWGGKKCPSTDSTEKLITSSLNVFAFFTNWYVHVLMHRKKVKKYLFLFNIEHPICCHLISKGIEFMRLQWRQSSIRILLCYPSGFPVLKKSKK